MRGESRGEGKSAGRGERGGASKEDEEGEGWDEYTLSGHLHMCTQWGKQCSISTCAHPQAVWVQVVSSVHLYVAHDKRHMMCVPGRRPKWLCSLHITTRTHSWGGAGDTACKCPYS